MLGELANSLVVIDPQEDTETLSQTLDRLEAEWPGIPCLVVVHNQEQERKARAGGCHLVLRAGFSAETLFEGLANMMSREPKEQRERS